MKNYLYVFFGGGFGAAARYWLSGLIPEWLGETFPYGILIVNVLGCFLIGFIMAATQDRFLVRPETRVLLTVGILGGFTTFSTFSYEALSLFRDTEYLKATLYVSLTVLGCLGAAQAGHIAGSSL